MHKHWWMPLTAVLIFGSAIVLFMGIKTYQEAPPIPDYIDSKGHVYLSEEAILDGQDIFQRKNLMDYGSLFGDGADRGPDYSADALHQMTLALREYHAERLDSVASALPERDRRALLSDRVKRDIKNNRYDAATGRVDASAFGPILFEKLVQHYTESFAGQGSEPFHPAGYIRDPKEIRLLAGFFYWSAWVCGTLRPGETYSYTQNWPYDEAAGNTPTLPTLFWSAAGLFGLVLALGLALFAKGKLGKIAELKSSENSAHESMRLPLAVREVELFSPSPTQKMAYLFFALAAAVFVLQVVSGILAIHDFVGFTTFFGFNLSTLLPVTITRAWHLTLALLWITSCWMGGSAFILPILAKQEVTGQRLLLGGLFALLVLIGMGTLGGIFLGPHGYLGDKWRWLGNQGWEYVEMGRLWQIGLFIALGLWAIIVVRGIRPALKGRRAFALPYWLVYAVIAVAVLFLSSFVAGPRTHFAIADYWRWMVIHMWAECFLEVFTTVVVACFLVLMGLVSEAAATRTVYFATLLFLGSGIVGISHNFYWSAKPAITLALGSVFSTLQVVPLLLLALEAWNVYRMPTDAAKASAKNAAGARPLFGQSIAFLFLLGVNFWNFMGAGVLGLLINLPIVNYYEHGTYLTLNHGHTAFMGVYGNLSIAALVFCIRFLVRAEAWNESLWKFIFWSLNSGLALMALLDLFPAGVMQFIVVLRDGYYAARSHAFIQSQAFQTLTWMRVLGGALFFVGGTLPLAAFVVSRLRHVKSVAHKNS